jgi:indole-3-glycerol phosphate synthase
VKTLKEVANDALLAVKSGYYDLDKSSIYSRKNVLETLTKPKGLVKAIRASKRKAVICEIKFASPSAGPIRNQGQVRDIVKDMEKGGATALSVLTESMSFGGSITNLLEARETSNLPIIMKDVVISKEQIEAAKKFGASAVLFIEEVFSEGLSKDNISLKESVSFAKNSGLETIVETHTASGLNKILDTDTDVVGINNRDLKTFETSLDTTLSLLREFKSNHEKNNRLIMSESGYESAADLKTIIRRLNENLSPEPDAFLIGTSIMRSQNIQEKVAEFVGALDS